MDRLRRACGWPLWIMPLALTANTERGRACESVSPRAHEIAAAQAIGVLPDPLGAYMRGHADRLRSLVHEIPELAAAHHTMRGDTHFLLLDIAARDGSTSERQRSAQAFPRDAGDAARVCKEQGRAECGRLPWGIIETYAALVVAFRANDEPRILAETATLLHLATDAAMPFDTTVGRGADSAGTSEAERATVDGGLPTTEFRSTAARVQTLAIGRAQERLAFEVRVWPGRFKPLRDPTTAVFGALVDAHRDVDELAALDRETIARLGPSPADRSSQEHYISAFPERGIAIIEQRLAAGVLLGAGLVHAAWTSAGSPNLTATANGSSTPELSAGTAKSSGCGQSFCGSRDSTVFHRSTCASVGRITPENLIGFASADEAGRAGRKPCRICKPDATNGPRR